MTKINEAEKKYKMVPEMLRQRSNSIEVHLLDSYKNIFEMSDEDRDKP